MTRYVYDADAYARIEVDAENEEDAFERASVVAGRQFETVEVEGMPVTLKIYDDPEVILVE